MMPPDDMHNRGPDPVTIIINTRPHEVAKGELSFEELAQLAYPNSPGGENVSFTETYRNGHGHKPDGSLLAGQSVKIKEGMVFNVIRTDKS